MVVPVLRPSLLLLILLLLAGCGDKDVDVFVTNYTEQPIDVQVEVVSEDGSVLASLSFHAEPGQRSPSQSVRIPDGDHTVRVQVGERSHEEVETFTTSRTKVKVDVFDDTIDVEGHIL